jgi:uncharacterized phiE125 gp8 family phage protein
MAVRLIAAPAVEAISLTEAKAHLRVNHSDEDTLISALIKAARNHLEGPRGFLARALVTQTWELVLDSFPSAEIMIPLPPLQSITFVKYADADGAEQTVAIDEYYVDAVNEPGWIVPLASWPGTLAAINAVTVRFVAGYPSDGASPPNLTANIPFDIKAAMLLHIGALYAQREQIIVGSTVAQLPWGAEQLLRPYRMQLSMA